ncbi:condensin-2 complex subunit H2 isoform X1 [Chiroxiphia lanceolata]|uniref:condensin-2 complex subunit H2 isoform X1 n=1 Tax=Chiroxiphia lanceolata TaxID=296741 RepID=UPI0013CE59E7|nr:condensin-2 complex subunit H2 isoform X1 [Chiroxiphia lanceolata]
MEEVESRFLHLLQPIRDLTKNWEVDVAAQLGEYLEELDQICISFDNGRTTMNFTEAALLIQGSACIYSRKVEYLYMLVCQALDCISNKKREKLPTSLRPDGRDDDATFTDMQEQFLSLDDIKDTSQASVDMSRNQQPSAVNVVPLTPMSLVPPEEMEKKENPLLSRKGEVLASRKDFRMNTCTPHATGAFLLELAGLSPTHLQEQRLGSPRRDTGTWGGSRGVSVGGHSPLTVTCHCALAGAPGSAPGVEHPSASVAPVRALSFSEEAGAAGPDDDNDIPGALGDDVEMTLAPNEHIEAQRSSPRTRGYVLREKLPSQDPRAHSKEVPDPWQSLDPFGDSEEKPFRKGRPFLMSHSLDDVVGGKRKRRGPRKLQDFMRWFSAAYNNVTDSRKTRRKGPTFADLEVLYWRQLKERLAAQRKLKSQGEPLWEPELEQEHGADCEQGAADDDFVEHEDVEQEDVEPEVPEELGEGSLDPPELGYEELVRRNVELFMASSQKFAQETELSQHIRRWEERIEPLLQEQEARAPFDMREYGLALTGRCGGLGQWHSLASLVAGQPPFEVCRYLLASLQLANDGVVELEQDEGLEAALDTARLRLLTLRPAHERFQGFQPPSLRDPHPK